MAEPSEPQRRARGNGAWRGVARSALGVLEWLAATACLIGGLCVVSSGAGWRVDLAANLAGHWGWALPVVAAWMAVRRRWGRLGVAGAGLALVLSVWLAPRAERVDPQRVPAERRVRVLHVNAGGMTPDATGLVGMIRSSGADIVAVTDCPTSLAREIWERRWVADLYPWCLRRPINANNPWQFVLSRWPIDDATAWGADAAEARPLTATVYRPGGALVFMLLHPLSPRTEARWHTGNALASLASAEAAGWIGRGWPVVASADLNATPTGHRAGLMRAGGLRQAAGRWERAGTYPAQRPWPWRVAIDDVWVGPGVRVASWRLAGSGPTQPGRDDGSDHEGVCVDLDVPAGRAPGSSPPAPGYQTSVR